MEQPTLNKITLILLYFLREDCFKSIGHNKRNYFVDHIASHNWSEVTHPTALVVLGASDSIVAFILRGRKPDKKKDCTAVIRSFPTTVQAALLNSIGKSLGHGALFAGIEKRGSFKFLTLHRSNQ